LIRRQLLKVVGLWLLLVFVYLLAVCFPSVSAEVIVSPVRQAASAAMLASSVAMQAGSAARAAKAAWSAKALEHAVAMPLSTRYHKHG